MKNNRTRKGAAASRPAATHSAIPASPEHGTPDAPETAALRPTAAESTPQPTQDTPAPHGDHDDPHCPHCGGTGFDSGFTLEEADQPMPCMFCDGTGRSDGTGEPARVMGSPATNTPIYTVTKNEYLAVLEARARRAALNHPIPFGQVSASMDSIAFEVRCIQQLLDDLSGGLLDRPLYQRDEVERVQLSLGGIETALERLADTIEQRPECWFVEVRQLIEDSRRKALADLARGATA